MGLRILVVDDEENVRKVLSKELSHKGHHAEAVAGGAEALACLAGRAFDVLLTDLKMPGVDGLALLRKVRELDLGAEVVLLTGQGSIPSAVEAIRQGAFDYLTKPCSIDEIEAVCLRAGERSRLARENRALRQDLARGLNPLLGDCPPMALLRTRIAKVAAADAHVLILGESGTGKELVARAVHRESPRSGGPFVAINCAGLAPSLLESELFGHERGAFTGADRARAGLFETADGGTLFLDELADMPPPLQALLLRTLQFGEVRRLGADRPRLVDARILAATHRDLEAAVRSGTFREDLYYRMKALVLEVPPLRDRRVDIALLARHFLARAGRGRLTLEAGALKVLEGHAWPGNVRELQNLMERLTIFCEGGAIREADVVAALQVRARPGAAPAGATLIEAEKLHIAGTLAAAGGSKPEAARRLGISLKTLYNKLKKHGL